MVPNDSRLPLTVITGYLGAGKTTLVNHLLRHADGRRILVLVNDFGDIAIDGDLIRTEEGDTLTLANGCICCSIGGDLFRALSNALDRSPRPDHLVIEASGVADPKRISDIARAEPELSHDGTIALVDSAAFSTLIVDGLVGASIARQLEASDLIVLNKTDLIASGEFARLVARVTALAPAALQVEARFGRVPADVLLGRFQNAGSDTFKSGCRAPGQMQDRPAQPDNQAHDPPHDHTHQQEHEQDYVRWSLTLDRAFDPLKLTERLQELPEGLLRLKGFVRLEDGQGWMLVQVVGRRVELDTSVAVPRDRRNTRLAAIGIRGLFDADQLDRLFLDP